LGEVAADHREADGGGYKALWGTEAKPPSPPFGRYSPQKGERQMSRLPHCDLRLATRDFRLATP